jgi:hypothetical protein
MIIGSYEQAIEDTVPGCMVPCDEQKTKDKHIQKVFFEKMKRDISVDRMLKARVKSIKKILENSQQQI